MISINLAKSKRIENEDLLAEIRTQACCVCKTRPADPSHIKTVGSGGPDERWNVVPHCRRCHTSWGTIGPGRFFERRPDFKKYLESLGWIWDGRKLRHPKLMKGAA